MGRIKLPEDYTEITYGQGESYGSGQAEVVEWIGFGIGCVGAAASIFAITHRAITGYWVWDRDAADIKYRKGMKRQEIAAYSGMTYKHRKAYLQLKYGPSRPWAEEDFRNMSWKERQNYILNDKAMVGLFS